MVQSNPGRLPPNEQMPPNQPPPPLEQVAPNQPPPPSEQLASSEPVLSSDGLWRWDGQRWISTVPNQYAIGQTTADGLWSWNGYEWRSTMPVPREGQSIAAPLSYVGSAQRIWRISHNEPRAALVPVAIFLITCAWVFVTWWYFLIFGVFGIFVIPFRLITRGQRRRLRQSERQHREMMAMLNSRR